MMMAVILAGDTGTLLNESESQSKPMVEIGGKPILWHIMKSYSAHGIEDFIICLGYKSYIIKEYFYNYLLHMSDVTLTLDPDARVVRQAKPGSWRVTLVDTGEETMTGGRIKRVASYLGDRDFCMTYGNAVSTVDIRKLISFHHSHGRAATITAVRPPARSVALQLDGTRVDGLLEKPLGDNE